MTNINKLTPENIDAIVEAFSKRENKRYFTRLVPNDEIADQGYNLSVSIYVEQEIIGEQNQKDFINLFGAILRLKNILTTFDAFTGNEILSERDMQDYQSIYIDLWHSMKPTKPEKENINDDIVFEIELIRQVEINIDYLLMLVQKYHKGNCEDKEILVTIDKAINSSILLRNKRELIENFIRTVNASTEANEDWRRFLLEQRNMICLKSLRKNG